MNKLFAETSRQFESIRTLIGAIARSRALLPLIGSGVLTIVLWNTGLFALLLDALPGWAQVPVMMPLFGSMLAVYALGGLATASLMLSVSFDLVMIPVRRLLPLNVEGV